jgi:hypothetical protein
VLRAKDKKVWAAYIHVVGAYFRDRISYSGEEFLAGSTAVVINVVGGFRR